VNEEKINILYVDDEENNLVSFKATFRLKYNVFIALSGEEAIPILGDNEIHVIITDQRMPGMTGVKFLETILPNYPDPMRILLTGYTDINAVIDAVNIGKIMAYLEKPWKEAELSGKIEEAYTIFKKRKEEREYADRLAISNDQFEFLLRQKLLS
jgi:response regulator RpfG family c-di-GMP phosphodiesterase